jgi:hypothetical protein
MIGVKNGSKKDIKMDDWILNVNNLMISTFYFIELFLNKNTELLIFFRFFREIITDLISNIFCIIFYPFENSD